MDSTKLMSLGIAAAMVWAAYKFGPPEVKGAALGVAGIIFLKNVPVPYLSNQV